MVFDAVQEVPQVCYISWLFFPSAKTVCPLPMIAVLTNNSANVAIA